MKIQFQSRAEKMEKSRNKTRKISLNIYLDFFHFGKQIDITINYLNQIILMHGFRKLWGVPKRVITEAIQSLDLMNLSRSTLRDNGVSSCASMNLEDIIADLNEIDWQDCCITTFETINFSSDNQNTAEDVYLVRNSHINGQLDGVETGRKRKKGNSGGDLRSSSTSSGLNSSQL
ncbi:uncharacterized protein [Euphorbia lathyris]|uniref:uncharacterized protein n=1 Tax=Euphorbia lathyris TaxID=212925 RepID=UPI0033134529